MYRSPGQGKANFATQIGVSMSDQQPQESVQLEDADRQGPDCRYQYTAQTAHGLAVTGAIDAPSTETAKKTLKLLGLEVSDIQQDPSSDKTTGRLSGDQFAAFNQQLALLTESGMPVESGLRMIARDIGQPKIKRAIESVVNRMEQGQSLDEAFAESRSSFPPMYATLIQAGTQGNQLSGVLMSLGRHLDMMRKLRAMLWRLCLYPGMLALLTIGVLVFLGVAVAPLQAVFLDEFDMTPPVITQVIIQIGQVAIPIAIGLAVIALLVYLAILLLRGTGLGNWVIDSFIIPLPLLGSVFQRNLAARWVDALRLGIEANLDLPAAIDLASGAVNTPRLRDDGALLQKHLAEHGDLSRVKDSQLQTLTGSVPTTIQFATGRGQLAQMLASLAAMYQDQSRNRLFAMQTILTPIALVVFGVVVGVILMGLFAPFLMLTSMLQTIM